MPAKRLGPRIKYLLDPFPFLEAPFQVAPAGQLYPDALSPKIIAVPAPTWTAVGRCLLHQLMATSHGLIEIEPGASIHLQLPETASITESELRARDDGGQPLVDCTIGDSPSHEVGKECKGRNEKQESQSPVLDDKKADHNINPMTDAGIGHSPPVPSDAAASIVVSRKRSLSSTGIQDGAEGGRLRSKRIRARESVMEAGTEERTGERGPNKVLEEQMCAYNDADGSLFETVGSFLQVYGAQTFDDHDSLKYAVSQAMKQAPGDPFPTKARNPSLNSAYFDLYALWRRWGEEKTQRASQKDSAGVAPLEESSTSRSGVIAAFLEHARDQNKPLDTKASASDSKGLLSFVQCMNKKSYHLKEVGWHWLMHLLFHISPEAPEATHYHSIDELSDTGYLRDTWPPPLKEAIVQMLVLLDGLLYSSFSSYLRSLDPTEAEDQTSSAGLLSRRSVLEVTSMAQTIFELHLDIYASITNPSSEVDVCIRQAQKDRLGRWTALVDDLMGLRTEAPSSAEPFDSLDLRYLWASAVHAGMVEGVSKEHVLVCMTDLRDALRLAGDPVTELRNNVAMPEVSSLAASRELTRLTTMDFFLDVMRGDGSNPVDTIEVLEPVLEPVVPTSVEELAEAQVIHEMMGVGEEGDSGHRKPNPLGAHESHILEVAAFLKKSAVSLRLFLWQRLQAAYRAIDYPPKVMSCNLRSIEVVMDDLRSPSHLNSPSDHRQDVLLRSLRTLEPLIQRAIAMGVENARAFECLDDQHLKSSMTAVKELCMLLHGPLMFEDPSRAAQAHNLHTPAQPSSAVLNSWKTKLRDMQLRAWLLLYLLMKDAMTQTQEDHSEQLTRRLRFLQSLHKALGIRHACHGSNRLFLRFVKAELFVLMEEGVEGWDQELFQVLYDLHDLRLGSGICVTEDHECSSEPLDRATAMRIVPLVMSLMQQVTVKDIQKPEYRSILEKMQQAVGLPTLEPTVAYNRRVLDHYFECSINPLELYGCIQGRNELSGVSVPSEVARIANTGWYHYLGTTALARFKAQKRVAPGAVEDLEDAARFLTIDLLLDLDRWETWYRLAQVFDLMLEEEVLWSAEELNKGRDGLRTLERKAIKCYVMALSSAVRVAEDGPRTIATLADLYSDFGSRLYASSRPPFKMEVFGVMEFQRHFSGSGGMYVRQTHRPLSLHKAWKFAAAMFRQALNEKPESWR